MTYHALNEHETFSEGDALAGQVTLALLKETTVESLFVKAKGDADVRWTKKSGDRTHTYHEHKRYFKLKQFLIPEDRKGELRTSCYSRAASRCVVTRWQCAGLPVRLCAFLRGPRWSLAPLRF